MKSDTTPAAPAAVEPECTTCGDKAAPAATGKPLTAAQKWRAQHQHHLDKNRAAALELTAQRTAEAAAKAKADLDAFHATAKKA
jgi:hypothetical protein